MKTKIKLMGMWHGWSCDELSGTDHRVHRRHRIEVDGYRIRTLWDRRHELHRRYEPKQVDYEQSSRDWLGKLKWTIGDLLPSDRCWFTFETLDAIRFMFNAGKSSIGTIFTRREIVHECIWAYSMSYISTRVWAIAKRNDLSIRQHDV